MEDKPATPGNKNSGMFWQPLVVLTASGVVIFLGMLTVFEFVIVRLLHQ